MLPVQAILVSIKKTTAKPQKKQLQNQIDNFGLVDLFIFQHTRLRGNGEGHIMLCIKNYCKSVNEHFLDIIRKKIQIL